MNNTGSDSPIETKEPETVAEARRVPAKVIVMGLVAIVFAVVIGSQVIGVLYAIFFPPAAPVPDQVTLVSHASKDYGVDDWLYTSSQTACDVLNFYQSKDAVCRVAPIWCGGDGTTQTRGEDSSSSGSGQNVARCVGTQNFSIFALRWEVVIATNSVADQLTQFRLNREIYWTGAVPPSNPATLDGGFPNFPTEQEQPTQAS